MKIKVISFGYKYENMPKASFVFDLRFLKNPYWQPGMRTLSGLDQAVFDFVMSAAGSEDFYQQLKQMVGLALKLAQAKETAGGHVADEVTIAFGCTGGQHRSVAFAQRLGQDLAAEGYDAAICHRDLAKSQKREIARLKEETKA
ncbi:RNase adapter RapZ [Oenococcus kitaharae]|uniref:RapZ C-terminal domain-containing protein n=1 Tax=Oenococcus kitaharae DSM 17330 TaxID=1045004 RepID=G9WFF1_9LACO|nr:RNase adapter RapZ [Oenococcus kitaharae]EHN59108.1 hypothetical protein OKIT_1005 [Oenococcus kitaharae DSM 17330]MCV3297032.1 hypothetical protein [Oenococcus kitaharae]OEY82009.1 hypothetical protein NV75_08930 [Oenococcus kitaharae]OEY82380.1 hypothetical protein NT95_06720 [Oenococcus kitaharae]OEY82786.1 hypothetical protein NT96_06360 [Oenococcus kitaharae]